MANITIAVTFNQYGHGDINIVPSDYDQWSPTQSDSKDYDLETGMYNITYVTVTGSGGNIEVTQAGNKIGGADFTAADGGGNFDIKIV